MANEYIAQAVIFGAIFAPLLGLLAFAAWTAWRGGG